MSKSPDTESQKLEISIKGESGRTYIFDKILGRGTFGVVYEAHAKDNKELKFAVKRYFRTFHPNCAQLEISIIFYLNKKIKDHNNPIVKLHDGFLDKKTGNLYMITSFLPHKKFTEYYKDLSIEIVKIYMKNLLTSLKLIHNEGIIHRDIKPDNFLFDLETKKSCLIDFGLAEADMDSSNWENSNKDFQLDEDYKIISDLQKHNYRHRTGTKGFLAPEIIFHSKFQSTSVDIWSAGVILLSFLSKRFPIFNLNVFNKISEDIIKEIEPLIIVFGRKKILDIADKCGCHIYISECFDNYQIGIDTLIKWKGQNDYEKKYIKLAIDLCKKMLEIDYSKRISAVDALEHEFFN